MKKAFVLSLFILCFGIAFASFTLSSKSADRLIIDFELIDLELISDGSFSHISLPFSASPLSPGSPSLPTLEFKIGVPPLGEATAKVINAAYEEKLLQERIAPVPQITDTEYLYEIDENAYLSSPKGMLKALERHRFRDYNFIPFILNPFEYDGQYSLKVLKSATIEVNISGNTSQKSSPSTDEYSQAILDLLLNAENAQYWIDRSQPTIHYADFSRSPWWARIETDKHGMFKISRDQLSAWPLNDLDPRTLRLFGNGGKLLPPDATYAGNPFIELPIEVIGEADGSFDSEDYIIFYGKNRNGTEMNAPLQYANQYVYHSPFAPNSVYWLTFAGDFDTPPLRISDMQHSSPQSQSKDYHSEILHIEEENFFRTTKGFSWFMSRLFGSTTASSNFYVELSDVVAGSQQRLKMRFQQEAEKGILTHKISVYVNDRLLMNGNSEYFIWASIEAFTLDVNTSYFHNGQNKITVKVHRNNLSDNIFLDYIEVLYAKKLIKSSSQYAMNNDRDPLNPSLNYIFSGNKNDIRAYYVGLADDEIYKLSTNVLNNGFSFEAPADEDSKIYVLNLNELYRPVKVQLNPPVDLVSEHSPITNLIIAPFEFLQQANELAEMYRQKWNLATKVVNQEDIINQFNGGHADPAALRQYIRYVYFYNGGLNLQNVTLLGTGSIDWRNFSKQAANNNRIMIYQYPTHNITSDDFLSMLSNNSYPEVAIGRYPVKSSAELAIMLKNFREYTFNPSPGLWRNSVLLLADDNVNGNVTNDWQHTQDVQAMSRMLHKSLLQTKLFAAEYLPDEFQNKPKVRDKMFEEINQGKLLWYYLGHGHFDALGMQNYFTGSTDMGRFANYDKLPLFVAATCDASFFDHWAFDCIGEKTVLLDNLGAIASVSSTRKSFPDPNHELMSYFLPNIMNQRRNLGFALMDAKIRHTSSTTNDAMYILFGDPNLRVIPPQRDTNLELTNLHNGVAHSRQTIGVSGHYGESGLNGQGSLIVRSPDKDYTIHTYTVNKSGPNIFKGQVSVNNSEYTGSFIVPDDISSGSTGIIYNYFWDENAKKDYLSYREPLSFSNQLLAGSATNEAPPQIRLYLDSLDYKDGDEVSLSPTLIAHISDDNGINITGALGHNILLILDGTSQLTSVTDYFQYDLDSHTSGTLIYQIPKLNPGRHSLQLLAFDNYNQATVATTEFIAKKDVKLRLSNLLIYPNPMKDKGHITFDISEDSDISVELFTTSGRKLNGYKSFARSGFNSIAFDARDRFGSPLANNSYFIRIKAKSHSGKKTEITETLVIYK